MTTNIYDIAHELERAIRDLPEYKSILAVKSEIDANPEAKAVLEDFAQAQAHLQDLVQQGLFPGQEEQERMQALGQRIDELPLLKNYFEQQQRISLYMADLEKLIFAPLTDLLS